MAGLYHDFFIKGVSQDNAQKRKDTIRLDDDLIGYIYDSLKWVKSYNPSKQESCMGLCLYGVTEIRGDALIQFKNIISVYRNLFEYAPNKIVLTGSYAFEDGEDMDSGRYEKLLYDKKDMLKTLDDFINMCEKALSEDKCILHYGI